MYPHRIRLRGPWELFRISESGESAKSAERINLPSSEDLAPFGPIRMRRRFGLPRTIDDNEHVWLTFKKMPNDARVSLNGHFLEMGPGADWELEVTALLRERNELCVELAGSGRAKLWEEAALEIRGEWHLRNVSMRVRSTANGKHLEARGQVVGAGQKLLDLYLLCDRSTVAFANLESALEGREFVIVSQVLKADEPMVHDARVELVYGSVVYHEVEEKIEF
jgi:hypothetical protein